uniref:Secreted protein n=1 Tax=Ascaris lumbricoides TaxID=6252 RepID=A0A0M3IPU4_ASCLU
MHTCIPALVSQRMTTQHAVTTLFVRGFMFSIRRQVADCLLRVICHKSTTAYILLHRIRGKRLTVKEEFYFRPTFNQSPLANVCNTNFM